MSKRKSQTKRNPATDPVGKSVPTPTSSQDPAPLDKWYLRSDIWGVLLGFLPLVLMLSHPLFYDEAYTLRNYVRLGPGVIATLYDLPNNHIGLNHALWFWSRIASNVARVSELEMLSPLVLRMGILVPSTLLLVVSLIRAGRSLGRPDTRMSGLAYHLIPALTLSPVVVALHAAQLRAYLPSMALLAWIVSELIVRFQDRPDRVPWKSLAWRLGLPIFVMLSLVPSNFFVLIPLLGIWLILLIGQKVSGEPHRPGFRDLWSTPTLRGSLLVIMGAGIAGVLFYVPVWEQLAKLGSRAPTFSDYLSRVQGNGIKLLEGLAPWWESPGPGVLFLGGGLASVAYGARRQSNYRLLLALTIAVVVGAPVLCSLSAPAVFSRNFCVLSPLVALCWLPLLQVLTRLSRNWIPALTEGDQPSIGTLLVPGIVVLGFYVGALLHIRHLWQTHRPDLVMASLAPHAGERDLILADVESDPPGLEAVRIQKSYPGVILGTTDVPPWATVQIYRTFLITSTQPTRDAAMTSHSLGRNGRLTVHREIPVPGGSARLEVFAGTEDQLPPTLLNARSTP